MTSRRPLGGRPTDTAVVRYLRGSVGGTSVRPERAAAGVSGAYGLFGATADARRTITLLPAE
jgi:hypothetical protein